MPRKDNTSAVSEVLGLLFVSSIILSACFYVLATQGNNITNQKVQTLQETTLKQFSLFDDALKDLLRQGVNSSAVFNFLNTEGSVTIDEQGTRFVIYYSLDVGFDFHVDGFNTSDPSYNPKTFTLYIDKPTSGTITYSIDITTLNDIPPIFQHITVSGSSPFTIPSNNPLVDAIRIDIVTIGGIPFGRIWLFDVGSLSYSVSSQFGTFQATLENGALVAEQSTMHPNMYISRGPFIYTNEEHQQKDALLAMKILQIKSDSGVSSAGGKGNYQFTTQYNKSDIRDVVSIPAKLYLQVFGEYTLAWKTYLIENLPTITFDDINERLSVFTKNNKPPNTPSIPYGNASGHWGVTNQYTFNSTTIDPDNDTVRFWFEWGDGENSGWKDSTATSTPLLNRSYATHYWKDNGTYAVTVKVKDSDDAESAFSRPFLITIDDETNHAPNIPERPYGPATGNKDQELTFSTVSVNPENQGIEYGWDWGDGSSIEWTSAVPSGEIADATHDWVTGGPKYVLVKARNPVDPPLDSGFSFSFLVTIKDQPLGTNNPPNTPDTPYGPALGNPGFTYTYFTRSIDPDGDVITYVFDWGDKTMEGGTTPVLDHSWTTAGIYEVTVKAIDDAGKESIFSQAFTVVISNPGFTLTHSIYKMDMKVVG